MRVRGAPTTRRLENFKAYMESDARKETVLPLLETIQAKFAVGGEVHSQNFVYKEI